MSLVCFLIFDLILAGLHHHHRLFRSFKQLISSLLVLNFRLIVVIIQSIIEVIVLWEMNSTFFTLIIGTIVLAIHTLIATISK